MKSRLRRSCLLAACLALSLPAAGNQSPTHAGRFVLALQEGRFDDAAAMFKPRTGHTQAATAAQLKRIAGRLGGLAWLRNVSSLPNGKTLMLEVPLGAPRASGVISSHQAIYEATAVDGQPVFYKLALDPAPSAQPVLWFRVHLPMQDATSIMRAQQALRDLN